MHRAFMVLSDDFDAACRDNGLRDMRDTLVLATAADGTPRTQIGIANALGLDKSTLMSIIDRLETEGHMVREADPSNRRIRVPRTTPQGQATLNRTLAARDEAANMTLSDFAENDIVTLRTLMWRIATAK